MNSKKKFLMPLAMVFAALASNSDATVLGTKAAMQDQDKTSPAANSLDSSVSPIKAGESREFLIPAHGDLYEFVLRRSSEGELLAYHYSHSSHSSHYSHRSHSSHYSSRY